MRFINVVFFNVNGKKLTQTDTTVSITFWQAAGLIPATFILAIQVWEWPTLNN